MLVTTSATTTTTITTTCMFLSVTAHVINRNSNHNIKCDNNTTIRDDSYNNKIGDNNYYNNNLYYNNNYYNHNIYVLSVTAQVINRNSNHNIKCENNTTTHKR